MPGLSRDLITQGHAAANNSKQSQKFCMSEGLDVYRNQWQPSPNMQLADSDEGFQAKSDTLDLIHLFRG